VTAWRGSLGAILLNSDSLVLKKLAVGSTHRRLLRLLDPGRDRSGDRGEHMQTANKVWLTPHKVEQVCGISRGLLWLLRGTGDLQSATIGSRELSVSRASLDAYMACRAQDASDG
jgi:hypothetical protein